MASGEQPSTDKRGVSLSSLPFSDPFRLSMAVLHSLVITIGCVGSVCVITVFVSDRGLWKSSYIFIGFLALVDMLHICLVGIYETEILSLGLNSWISEYSCWWFSSLMATLMTLSDMTTVVIAVNRYVRVCYSSLLYARLFPPRLVPVMCLILAVCASLWPIRSKAKYYSSLPGCFMDLQRSRIRLSLMLGQYLVGYCVVIILYSRMTRKITRLSRKLKPKICSNAAQCSAAFTGQSRPYASTLSGHSKTFPNPSKTLASGTLKADPDRKSQNVEGTSVYPIISGSLSFDGPIKCQLDSYRRTLPTWRKICYESEDVDEKDNKADISSYLSSSLSSTRQVSHGTSDWDTDRSGTLPLECVASENKKTGESDTVDTKNLNPFVCYPDISGSHDQVSSASDVMSHPGKCVTPESQDVTSCAVKEDKENLTLSTALPPTRVSLADQEASHPSLTYSSDTYTCLALPWSTVSSGKTGVADETDLTEEEDQKTPTSHPRTVASLTDTKSLLLSGRVSRDLPAVTTPNTEAGSLQFFPVAKGKSVVSSPASELKSNLSVPFDHNPNISVQKVTSSSTRAGRVISPCTSSKQVDNLRFGFVVCTLNMTTCIPFWVTFVFGEMFELPIPAEVQCVSHLLVLCGSAFNSVVYGVMNSSFQLSGKKLYRKIRLKLTGHIPQKRVQPQTSKGHHFVLKVDPA